MKFFKAIGSALFGGSETASKTVDFVAESARGIGTWIDERNFTEEEKSKADFATLQTVLKGIEATRDENSTRSITRRYLAWSIMGVYLLSFLVTITIGYSQIEYRKFLLEAVQVYGIDTLAWAVGGFYFLASITRSLRSK